MLEWPKVNIMSRVTFALAAAACVAVASPSLAADMYGGQPAAPYGGYAAPAPQNSWTGAYAGVQAGHGWGSNDLNGGQIGVYGGINANVGANFVAGVEGDINVSGQNSSRMIGPNYYKYDSSWNGSVRGRAGVAFDRVMPFATGGIAFADDSMKTFGGSSSKTKVGYVAGAGVEAQVADHITVKGELLHYGFGRSNHALPTGTQRSSVDTNVLRGGVAYRY